ncbi:MAG TPA: hypothetical protein DCE14_09090 [Kosmotogaceae bacterium]|nr:hypothetical protein [Kosmotogaceae bacterium]
MKLLFDENVHNKVVDHFASERKYEVTKVSSLIRGAPDSRVAALAEVFVAECNWFFRKVFD